MNFSSYLAIFATALLLVFWLLPQWPSPFEPLLFGIAAIVGLHMARLLYIYASNVQILRARRVEAAVSLPLPPDNPPVDISITTSNKPVFLEEPEPAEEESANDEAATEMIDDVPEVSDASDEKPEAKEKLQIDAPNESLTIEMIDHELLSSEEE